MELHFPDFQKLPIVDLSIEIIMQKENAVYEDRVLDPMLLEFQPSAIATYKQDHNFQVASHAMDIANNNAQTEASNAVEAHPIDNQMQNLVKEGNNITQGIEGEALDLSAPPGFPIPAFLNHAHTVCPSMIQEILKAPDQTLSVDVSSKQQTEVDLIGKEGAKI